nr:hypothetical protein GCM10025699_77460 [Microbacterium flavescens]
MTAAPVVSFEHVSKSYTVQGRRFDALHDVSLEVPRGQIFGIVGYSGAGKSTLLRTVNALERPTSGRVVVDGQEVSALRGKELYAARRRIGMVFQQFNLLSSRTVFGNVAYPLRLSGLSRDETVDRVEELLDFASVSRTRPSSTPPSSRAARSSASASPGPWRTAPTCSSRTRRPAPSTRRRRARCSTCCGGSTTSTA